MPNAAAYDLGLHCLPISNIKTLGLYGLNFSIQCSPLIRLQLGSIRMYRIISEPCYKGTILQRNYRKMTINYRKMTIIWSFPIIPL